MVGCGKRHFWRSSMKKPSNKPAPKGSRQEYEVMQASTQGAKKGTGEPKK